MGIPARTTLDWFILLDVPNHGVDDDQHQREALAATTAELDDIWRQHAGDSPRPRTDIPITIWGRPIVEIPDWPDWMP